MDDAPIPLDAPAPAPHNDRTIVGRVEAPVDAHAPNASDPASACDAPMASEAPIACDAPIASEAPIACDATIVSGTAGSRGVTACRGTAASTSSPPSSAVRAFTDPIMGKQIGGATITGFVGEGGMGRVYLGELTDPPRRVAVKLLSRGFDNPEAVGRFQREAAILDRLRHPGVAEILGHGVWDDGSGGIPFMLIELVEEAKTLADFATEKRLDRRARLELFHRACEAIGFAHEMKILHRDLKPANLLVDRWGRVKVIDFGVARAANGDLGIAGVRTETGQLIGTVQYMSPEQIAGDPRSIDLGTDVYALGVILYEMLLDAYPYDVRGLPLHEAARVVSEAVIEWPRRLDPSIDEALEAIVMRCLNRDRTQRYTNAVEVAKALERYLSGPSASAAKPAAVRASSNASACGDADDDMLLDLGCAAMPPSGAAHGATSGAHAGGAGARRNNQARHKKNQQRISVAACGAGGGSARRGWGLVFVVVVAAVGAGLIATGIVDVKQVRAWIPGSLGGTASPATVQADIPVAAPSSMSTESLTILSAPSGASVSVDGKAQGQTPLSLMVTWNEASARRMVEVSAPGFESAAAVVMPDPAGQRAEPLRLVFNLPPRGDRSGATLDRLLPLVIEGAPVEVRVDGGTAQRLLPGRREIGLALAHGPQGWQGTRVSFSAPGHRIEAFGRTGDGALVVDISCTEIGDQPQIVRLTPS